MKNFILNAAFSQSMSQQEDIVKPNTHLAINSRLCGEIHKLSQGKAIIDLTVISEMEVDAHHLIHGGFIFGLADYAAMMAVNDPLVVLAGAEVKFLRPCTLGDQLRAIAEVQNTDPVNPKNIAVSVEVHSQNKIIFKGEFRCAIPKRHVLAKKE